jgi:hypothetical protein
MAQTFYDGTLAHKTGAMGTSENKRSRILGE